MPSQTPKSPDDEGLLLRLIGGDPAAARDVLAAAATSKNPSLLVAAALLSSDRAHLARASKLASTPRDRQLTVLADAHLREDADLFDGLVRDHLADHPDHLLAAWIAGHRPHPTNDLRETRT
jgi:hypothetical protein